MLGQKTKLTKPNVAYAYVANLLKRLPRQCTPRFETPATYVKKYIKSNDLLARNKEVVPSEVSRTNHPSVSHLFLMRKFFYPCRSLLHVVCYFQETINYCLSTTMTRHNGTQQVSFDILFFLFSSWCTVASQ